MATVDGSGTGIGIRVLLAKRSRDVQSRVVSALADGSLLMSYGSDCPHKSLQ